MPAREKTGKWNGDGVKEIEKPLARAPKSRCCYICGRLYMPHSFSIHEPQCRKLFLDREALKPPKERKPCPEDPVSLMRVSRAGAGGHKAVDSFVADGGSSESHRGFRPDHRRFGGFSLDEINAASQAAYSEATLSRCRYCDRTMLPEKLPKHNVLCTREHPARRVGEGVRVDRTAVRTAPSARTQRSAVTAAHAQAQAQAQAPVQRIRAHTGSLVRAQEADTKDYGAGAAQTSWRNKSNSFRAAVAQARRVTRAEQLAKETGQPVSSFLAPPSAEEQRLLNQANAEGMVECANCLRTFSRKAGERHIPLCKSIINKPARLVRGSGSSKMGRSNENKTFGLSTETSRPRSPPSMTRSAPPGPTVTIQKATWTTGDTGVSVHEKPRLGRLQRQHPSPPVTPPSNSVLGPQPYGFSKRPGSGGGASSFSDVSRRGTGTGMAERAGARAVPAQDVKSRTGVGMQMQMATVHGDVLHRLMETKKNVALTLSGGVNKSRGGNRLVR